MTRLASLITCLSSSHYAVQKAAAANTNLKTMQNLRLLRHQRRMACEMRVVVKFVMWW